MLNTPWSLLTTSRALWIVIRTFLLPRPSSSFSMPPQSCLCLLNGWLKSLPKFQSLLLDKPLQAISSPSSGHWKCWFPWAVASSLYKGIPFERLIIQVNNFWLLSTVISLLGARYFFWHLLGFSAQDGAEVPEVRAQYNLKVKVILC